MCEYWLQGEDVIIRDGRENEDITTKDRDDVDDICDRPSHMMRSNVCIGQLSCERGNVCPGLAQ